VIGDCGVLAAPLRKEQESRERHGAAPLNVTPPGRAFDI
jgi:hypothetical protein